MQRALRWRRGVRIGGIAMVLVALGALTFLPPPNEVRHLERDLASAAAQAGPGGRIRLEAVAPFAWDRVYVIGAYAGIDDVKRDLGFDWQPVSRFDAWLWGDLFMANDGFSLLVFVRGEREVTGYRVLNPGNEWGVYVEATLPMMPRNTASFEVTRSDAGSGWKLT